MCVYLYVCMHSAIRVHFTLSCGVAQQNSNAALEKKILANLRCTATFFVVK